MNCSKQFWPAKIKKPPEANPVAFILSREAHARWYLHGMPCGLFFQAKGGKYGKVQPVWFSISSR